LKMSGGLLQNVHKIFLVSFHTCFYSAIVKHNFYKFTLNKIIEREQNKVVKSLGSVTKVTKLILLLCLS